MAVANHSDLREYCLDVARRARSAGAKLAATGGAQRDAWLLKAADLLASSESALLAANSRDLAAATEFGLDDAQIDRLRLTPRAISAMTKAIREIAGQRDPIGEIIESSIRPNGLEVQKIRVPLGVVFFIYESRPNVTADASAICIKSGNAVILRGGREAAHSNRAIADAFSQAAATTGMPQDAVQLVSTTDREAVGQFLAMSDLIDVAIPRGGESLIRRVAEEARMPVIKHFTGNCHVYVDRSADLEMAERIVLNAKCQRMGVCNAAESLLVHADVAEKFLPLVGAALAQRGIELRGDERTQDLVPSAVPASDDDYFTEFLGPVLSVCVVDSLDAAIAHIAHYGSKHTDAIVTADLAAAREFATRVDSSAVIVNASTRFNDGGEFGLGAEIGISTDKFHARGPCGVNELTSYKYVVYGAGQLRE